MMSIKQKISNFFKKNWQLLLGVVASIIAFIIGVNRNEKNSSATVDSIADPIISDNVAEFRDRSNEMVRGIFSDRGHTRNPNDSGGTSVPDGTGNEAGVRSGVQPEGQSDSSPTGAGKNTSGSSNSNLSGDSANIRRDSRVPINQDDKALLEHIEGAMIRRKGGHFLALLAIQQLRYGALTAKEVVSIYNQARKDPSIMSYDCILGKKDYLITYHAKMFYTNAQSLERCTMEQAEYLIQEWVNGENSEFRLLDSVLKPLFNSTKIKNAKYLGTIAYRWV